jgi:hypothetical protein
MKTSRKGERRVLRTEGRTGWGSRSVGWRKRKNFPRLEVQPLWGIQRYTVSSGGVLKRGADGGRAQGQGSLAVGILTASVCKWSSCSVQPTFRQWLGNSRVAYRATRLQYPQYPPSIRCCNQRSGNIYLNPDRIHGHIQVIPSYDLRVAKRWLARRFFN